MTDIQVGDRVRFTVEGEVRQVRPPNLSIRTDDDCYYWYSANECTLIDPPVKVGDEITYEQAIRLPHKSVVVGLVTGDAYQIKDGALRYGDRAPYSAYQTLRVLYIPDND